MGGGGCEEASVPLLNKIRLNQIQQYFCWPLRQARPVHKSKQTLATSLQIVLYRCRQPQAVSRKAWDRYGTHK